MKTVLAVLSFQLLELDNWIYKIYMSNSICSAVLLSPTGPNANTEVSIKIKYQNLLLLIPITRIIFSQLYTLLCICNSCLNASHTLG